MAYSHEDVVDDAEYLTRSEVTLLAIVNCGPVRITRIQKLGLFIEKVLEGKLELSYGAYNFGAYSDSLGEAVSSMVGDGAIKLVRELYQITPYGSDLLSEAKNNPDFKELVDKIPQIVSFFESLSDQQLLRLSYVLYPETTGKSLIKDDVDKINSDRKSFKIGDLEVTTGLSKDEVEAELKRRLEDV